VELRASKDPNHKADHTQQENEQFILSFKEKRGDFSKSDWAEFKYERENYRLTHE
jgi:hypothetical protein